MSSDSEKPVVSRRKFLLGATAGAGAVAAAQLVTSQPATAMNAGPEEGKARYRVSNEVKIFYRVNGYEGRK